MPTLQDVVEIGRRDHFFAVVSTLRGDSVIQASVVNAGVLAHPLDAVDVVGFVTYGQVKLTNLRARPQLTITFRAGGSWVAVEGRAELIGTDDVHPEIPGERLRLLLREVYAAAGGDHDDWEAYDREMAEQRRAAVLVRPLRIYSNPVVR
jgi:PPOX class probable F420-dependent enzyme